MKYDKNLFSFSDGIYRTKIIFKKRIEFKGKKIDIEVPYEFAWNGVTGFRTTKKTLIPSMIHDWLIYDRRINGNERFTRKEMDEIFLWLCKMYRVPVWERMIFKVGLSANRDILS